MWSGYCWDPELLLPITLVRSHSALRLKIKCLETHNCYFSHNPNLQFSQPEPLYKSCADLGTSLKCCNTLLRHSQVSVRPVHRCLLTSLHQHGNGKIDELCQHRLELHPSCINLSFWYILGKECYVLLNGNDIQSTSTWEKLENICFSFFPVGNWELGRVIIPCAIGYYYLPSHIFSKSVILLIAALNWSNLEYFAFEYSLLSLTDKVGTCFASPFSCWEHTFYLLNLIFPTKFDVSLQYTSKRAAESASCVLFTYEQIQKHANKKNLALPSPPSKFSLTQIKTLDQSEPWKVNIELK